MLRLPAIDYNVIDDILDGASYLVSKLEETLKAILDILLSNQSLLVGSEPPHQVIDLQYSPLLRHQGKVTTH